MANFTPEGTIHIGRVPFDNSYRHTIDCFTEATQASVMQGFCTKSLSRADYTYVRMNNSIRVPYNAEDLYTYNYVMYQNSNYGTKWFYAFITAINYVNENCTELVLELDVLQTWWYDWSLEECFVEREHVNDDRIGYNNIAEPAMDIEYIAEDCVNHSLSMRYIVLLVNAYPHYSQSSTPDDIQVLGSDPVEGDIYYGQYNACKMLVYDYDNATSMNQLKSDIKAFNMAGAADTIADAFVCDAGSIDSDDLVAFKDWRGTVAGVYTLNETLRPPINEGIIKRPTNLGGYVPRNNKLFVYPYVYCELGDYTGRTMDYRYEMAKGTDFDAGQITFASCTPLGGDLTTFVWSPAYNGDNVGAPSHNIFTVDVTNKVSWVYSAYQNWAAQNMVANQLAVIGSTAGIAFSMMPGISGAAAALGQGLAESNVLTNAGYPNMGNIAYGAGAQRAGSALAEGVSGQGVAAGILGLGATLATVDRMKKVPNTARGNIAGNARFQADMAGYYMCNVRIRAEWARCIDDFFDMYGYQVDRLKKPNMKGRASWNYVKCQNSCNHGNVPAPDMAKINRIMDSGLTIWHTADVGNYSLDNSIS